MRAEGAGTRDTCVHRRGPFYGCGGAHPGHMHFCMDRRRALSLAVFDWLVNTSGKELGLPCAI